MANSMFALGRAKDARIYEKNFMKLAPAKWEVETYKANKSAVLNIKAKKTI